ncbi:glycosyltransferase [Mariniflexile sp.]|uniref:glycosyltransferase n=1 Tax=Mariniflexile sp. TaxID=1979402 RepID=UPI00356A6D4D
MKQKKIAIISPSAGNGGAEKASTLLSLMLENLNYEVHFIAAYTLKDFKVGGQFYCLQVPKATRFSFVYQFFGFIKLRRHIKRHNFDAIIDFRSRRRFLTELVFTYFVVPRLDIMIYTFHLPLMDKYIPKPWFLFRSIYNKAEKIVCVSKGIKQKTEEIGLENTQVILNPIDFKFIEDKIDSEKLFDFEYIIGVGRMDDNIKQFDHLMEAYSNSVLPEKHIHLVILGKGQYQSVLEDFQKTLPNGDKIHFAGFQDNPYKYMHQAKFFVLSSKFEGFPLVVLEALACGTPVISYDCPTGPSEIIEHEKNGLLIPAQNKRKLTEGMNAFVENEIRYNQCKANAKKSIAHLTMEDIGKQWQTLLEN